MKAFHSLWTKPYIKRNGASSYACEDFELITAALSALEWRKHNGGISLVTDSEGADYVRALGADALYDDISTALDAIPESVDPDVYWAGGKLYALRTQTAPIVMLDTDFIVWEHIDFDAIHSPAAVIHKEDMYEDIYPPVSSFKTESGYKLPVSDENALPSNTAFTYIADKDFLHFYTDTAIEFMERTPLADHYLTYMVFAEQRLISMCASEKGFEIPAFGELDSLFSNAELFTHIWGFKEELRRNTMLRASFISACLRRIKEDFPDFYKTGFIKSISENNLFEVIL